MTDAEKKKAWRAEQRKIMQQSIKLQTDTLGAIADIMDVAKAQILSILETAPTDYQAWLLPQLERQINVAMSTMGTQAGTAAHAALLQSWELGILLVDAPLRVTGTIISPLLPVMDTRQLLAIQHLTTSKISGITASLVSKINTQLGLVVMAAQTPSDAVTSITSLMDEGDRSRAIGIVRTELAQVRSFATYQRLKHSAKLVPGLEKQWRKSNRLHPRITHVVADGQIRSVDEPFMVGGVAMMHPHDPTAPLDEIINCGCTMLPYRSTWSVQFPGKHPSSVQIIS